MIFDHAEMLNEYPEGTVFLKKMPRDTIFIDGNNGDIGYSIPCTGKSETKSTILLSGIDDDIHFGLYRNESYYVLEEKTLWLDKNISDFETCQNHFGGKVPLIKKIYLKTKHRITLLEFKNLFAEDILMVTPLNNHRIQLHLEIQWYYSDGPYCGPIPLYYLSNKHYKNTYETTDRVEKVLNLGRPWEFAEEKVIQKYNNLTNLIFTREKLPDVNPWDLYEQIKDVEVDLGTYSYLLTDGCKQEFDFPKKKWREIINWRPPWK